MFNVVSTLGLRSGGSNSKIGEIMTTSEKALALVQTPGQGSGGPVAPVNREMIKIKRQLVSPLLKHADHEDVWIMPLNQMSEGEVIEKSQIKTPAQMITVLNLAANDRIEYKYIVSHIVANELNKHFPNHSYVGKKFLIHKFPKEQGKRFNTFSVDETE